jgi:hypothetical protein
MVVKKWFFSVFLFILVMPMIFAASSAPTSLVFEDNSNANYDEGVFSVNWTSGGGEVEIGYFVYIYSDEVFLMVAPNSSDTGYQVSHPSDAKYSFIIESLNSTNHGANSSVNISINVESIIPSISIINFIDKPLRRDSGIFSMNVFANDSGSGLISSSCVFGIDGNNYTVPVSSGWCNSTSISLTGAGDGNKTIFVHVNDSANNVAVNSDYSVWMDSSGPVIVFTCTPSSVYINQNVTCECNVSDSGIGVNYTEFSANPPTSELGTFTRTCTSVDLLGNSNSENFDYTVAAEGSPYVGNNPPDPSTDSNVSWVYTYSINESIFQEGYTKSLSLKRRIKAPISSEYHSIGVLELNETHVKLEIASTPVERVLGIGESFKLDILGDGYYDVYVLLNAILNNNSANLTVKNIHESVSGSNSVIEGDPTNDTGNLSGNVSSEDEGAGLLGGNVNRVKIFILSGVGILVVVLFLILYFVFRKRSRGKVRRIMKKNKNQIIKDNENSEVYDIGTIPLNSSDVVEDVSFKSQETSGTPRGEESTEEASDDKSPLDSIVDSHPETTDKKPKTGAKPLPKTQPKPAPKTQSKPLPLYKPKPKPKNLPKYKPNYRNTQNKKPSR